MLKITAARIGVPLMAAAIIATGAAGVTYAASASHGAKACATSKGVLVLASAKGKCPKHDSKVTLGKTGPKGAKGAAGPSAGYLATQKSPITLAIGQTVDSMSLPAGSYLLTANVAFSSSDANEEEPTCHFAVDTTSSIPFQTDLAPQTGTTIKFPGLGAVGLSSGLKLAAASSVDLVCGASDEVKATASMSAQLVGTIHATGAVAFS